VFIYYANLLGLEIIVLSAVLGSHLGDMSGFFFGKRLGPNILETKFIKKREKKINKARRFLERNGTYSVVFGRFVPAIRSIVPFLLGISNLKPVRFYISDVIACSLWGVALAFLVIISDTFIG
jgi:membrane protein DedA with SNARE-associated domain